jgi:hypothetical protein
MKCVGRSLDYGFAAFRGRQVAQCYGCSSSLGNNVVNNGCRTLSVSAVHHDFHPFESQHFGDLGANT